MLLTLGIGVLSLPDATATIVLILIWDIMEGKQVLETLYKNPAKQDVNGVSFQRRESGIRTHGDISATLLAVQPPSSTICLS